MGVNCVVLEGNKNQIKWTANSERVTTDDWRTVLKYGSTHPLHKWLYRQWRDWEAGLLTPERRSAIEEALPGWEDRKYERARRLLELTMADETKSGVSKVRWSR